MANIPQRGRPAPFVFPGSGPFMRRAAYYAGPPAAPAPGGCDCGVPPAPAPRSCCQACAVGAPCGTKLGDPWTPEQPSPVGPITAYPVAETMRNLQLVHGGGSTAGAPPVLFCKTAKAGESGEMVMQCFDSSGAAAGLAPKKTCWNVTNDGKPPTPMECFEDL